MAGIRHFTRSVHATTGEDEDTSRIQAVAELLQYLGLAIKRDVPDAVPCRDKIIPPRELPSADVGLMKAHVRMLRFGQREHLGGNIQSFDLETAFQQKINEPSVAAASDVDCESASAQKLDGSLMLDNTIPVRKFSAGPVPGDLVVISGCLAWIHLVAERLSASKGQARTLVAVVRCWGKPQGDRKDTRPGPGPYCWEPPESGSGSKLTRTRALSARATRRSMLREWPS
jgi:hypothetical protein